MRPIHAPQNHKLPRQGVKIVSKLARQSAGILGTFDIASEGYCTDLQSYALLQFSSPRRIDQHFSW
jgi:hypothetical protein